MRHRTVRESAGAYSAKSLAAPTLPPVPAMEVLLLMLDELDDAVAILRHRAAAVLPFLGAPR